MIEHNFDYHEAIRQMHEGNVVQYAGTVNGQVWKRGLKFCMQRGCIFVYDHGVIPYKSIGSMVYDPDFRYILTNETVDPRGWVNNPKDEIKSALGYSRIGLGNV